MKNKKLIMLVSVIVLLLIGVLFIMLPRNDNEKSSEKIVKNLLKELNLDNEHNGCEPTIFLSNNIDVTKIGLKNKTEIALMNVKPSFENDIKDVEKSYNEKTNTYNLPIKGYDKINFLNKYNELFGTNDDLNLENGIYFHSYTLKETGEEILFYLADGGCSSEGIQNYYKFVASKSIDDKIVVTIKALFTDSQKIYKDVELKKLIGNVDDEFSWNGYLNKAGEYEITFKKHSNNNSYHLDKIKLLEK